MDLVVVVVVVVAAAVVVVVRLWLLFKAKEFDVSINIHDCSKSIPEFQEIKEVLWRITLTSL